MPNIPYGRVKDFLLCFLNHFSNKEIQYKLSLLHIKSIHDQIEDIDLSSGQIIWELSNLREEFKEMREDYLCLRYGAFFSTLLYYIGKEVNREDSEFTKIEKYIVLKEINKLLNITVPRLIRYEVIGRENEPLTEVVSFIEKKYKIKVSFNSFYRYLKVVNRITDPLSEETGMPELINISRIVRSNGFEHSYWTLARFEKVKELTLKTLKNFSIPLWFFFRLCQNITIWVNRYRTLTTREVRDEVRKLYNKYKVTKPCE